MKVLYINRVIIKSLLSKNNYSTINVTVFARDGFFKKTKYKTVFSFIQQNIKNCFYIIQQHIKNRFYIMIVKFAFK